MFRYFTAEENIKDNAVRIQGTDAKHLKNTLRAEIGEKINVVTDSCQYEGVIKAFVNDSILVDIVLKTDVNNEASTEVILCQGLPKQSKMEDIIQQNTELGVKRFIPVATERAVVKINDASRENKKLERWRKIAHESSKQSKRNAIPEVEEIISFKDLVNRIKDENAKIIVPYELENSKTMKEALEEKSDKYYVIIGPEGGFDSKEIAMLQDINAEIVTLGKRILRTETAGLVACSIIFHECGEMGR